MTRLIALFGATLLLAAGSAAAAVAQTRQPAEIEALLACRTKAGEAERLACYDSAVAQIDQAVRSGNVAVVDGTEVRRVRRSLFGFSIPDFPFLGGKDGKEEVRELTATVQSASLDGFRKLTVTLANGAVWRTTEPLKGFRNPGRGSTVTLRKGALGGYWLTVANGRPVRAMRVR